MSNIIIRNEKGTTFINLGMQPATVSIHKDHCLYEQTQAFNEQTPWQSIVDACNAPFREVFDKIVNVGSDVFHIRGDSVALQVVINGEPVDLPLSIIKHTASVLTSGGQLTSVLNFIKRIQKNPNPEIYQDLFAWVQNGDFVLTEDGCFLAYKKVCEDYKDIYTGTMDNSIGATPEVPRHKVVRDREQTCAYGLHWCSWDYLSCYGSTQGYRVVLVKVAPEDVDRIPVDYNRQKGVSWTYTVIGEIDYARDTSSVMKDSHSYNEETGQFTKHGELDAEYGADEYCPACGELADEEYCPSCDTFL